MTPLCGGIIVSTSSPFNQETEYTPMCQLLGMNCNVPTDVTFSFTGFAQRGGKTDDHSDVWGIAFFAEK